jgi:hypothetical protein
MLTKLMSDRAQAEYVRLQQKLMASANPPKNFLRWRSNTNDKDASVIGDISTGWGTTWSKGSPLLIPDVPCGCIEIIVPPPPPPVPVPTFRGVGQWAVDAADGSPVCGVLSTVTDASRNIYVLGYYTNSITIYNYLQVEDGIIVESPYGILNSLNPSNNLFLIKYTPNGSVVWATSINALAATDGSYSNQTDAGNFLVIDSRGFLTVTFLIPQSPTTKTINIYNAGISVAGQIQTTLYGSLSLSTTQISFGLTQFDASGMVQWMTTASAGSPYAICTDVLRNINVCGTTTSNILFNTIGTVNPLNQEISVTPVFTLVGGSSQTGFLVKYDSSGTVKWAANQLSNPGRDIFPYSLVADRYTNLYMLGSFTNNILFNTYRRVQGGVVQTFPFGTMRSLLNAESTDIFLVKYTSIGVCDWATGLLGVAGNRVNRGLALTIDASQSLCVAGSFNSYPLLLNDASDSIFQTVRLTPFANLYSYASTGANSAIFLAKYNTDGKAIWATSMISLSTGVAADFARSLVTDLSNNIYLACTYSAPLTLNNYISVFNSTIQTTPYGILQTVTGSTALVAYSSIGRVLWAASQSGTSPLAHGITIDGSNNLILVGERTAPLTVQNFEQTQTDLPSTIQETPFGILNRVGSAYGFIAKYSSR